MRLAAACLGLAIAAGLLCVLSGEARAQGRVAMGVRCDAPPFAYWRGDPSRCGEPGGGEFRGFIVELCRTALRSLGREFQEVAVTAASRFSALKDGQADILCEATTATVARTSEIHFSQIVFVSGVSYLYATGARKPGGDNPDKVKVGVLRGTTAETTVGQMVAEKTFRVGEEGILRVHPETHAEGVRLICNGELDFYVGDRDIITTFASRIPNCAARPSGKFFSYEPYAIAVARRDPQLAVDIQRALYAAFAGRVPERLFPDHFPQKEPSTILKTLWALQTIPGGTR